MTSADRGARIRGVLKRTPGVTVEQIAKATGMSQDEVQSTLDAQRGKVASRDGKWSLL